MLDDRNVLIQRDPSNALGVASEQYQQVQFEAEIQQGEYQPRPITQVVIAGMGGSALAAGLIKTWLSQQLSVPFEVVRNYDLPAYVGENTMVIASSYSGNTEETVSALEQAGQRGAQVAVVASGGRLIELAKEHDAAYVQLPAGLQPRMAVFYGLRGMVRLLAHFQVIGMEKYDEIAELSSWLDQESVAWEADVPTARNYAKQLALQAVGKTPVIYAGNLLAPVAYKWKISFNENAKNVAFMGELPEFNHNEFLGWSSHPIDKPFAVFDLVSQFEHERTQKRFEISDRLLSGMRPKAITIQMRGETPLAQMLWGCILADFISIYTAILNGVDPTPVVLIEKLKVELTK